MIGTVVDGTGLALDGGVTLPRIVAKQATYAVTRRCVCRKGFLGWWDPAVDDIWLWCLALAATKNRVTIHHAVRVGSHYHLTFTCSEANLGAFLWWLNHHLSRALNVLLAKRGYDAPGQLFDGRPTHVMRLMDAEAQLGSLLYERLNPPAAGLAATCDGVPGVTLPPGLWKAGGRLVRRPKVLFSSSGPETRWLPMGPPPLLYLAFGGDMDAMLHHIGKLEREGERAIRAARRGRPVRTAAEVRAIHPWDEPVTLRRDGGGRVPCFKTGLGRLAQIRGAVEVRRWRGQYREAREAYAEGDRDMVFPHGTHAMRRDHGVKVAEPAPDAWVSAPGISIEEAKALVGRGEVERDDELVNRVREVVLEAVAEDVVGDDDHDEPADDDEDAPARPAPVTIHRFSNKRVIDPADAPRRLIILRDARRRRRRDDGPPQD